MNGENADQMDPQQPYHLPYDYDIGEERKPRSKTLYRMDTGRSDPGPALRAHSVLLF